MWRRRPEPVAHQTQASAELEIALALEARRSAVDGMLWQVPAVALAAQAFLLTITLGADSALLARGIAAAFGAVAALVAVQLIAKYRYIEELYSWASDERRRAAGTPPINVPAVHEWLVPKLDADASFRRWTHGWRRRTVTQLSSYRVWVLLLWSFVVADAALLAVTALEWRGVLSPFG